MKKLLILCAFFMPFFVSAANTPVVEDFPNSSRIYRRQFSLTANTQYKFRTFSNNNPVLYLLNSSNVQVAMNNNCGSDCLSTQNSYDSTLTYTPTTSGYYYIVMVNNNSGQVGETANLKQYANGTLLSSVDNAPLGGIKYEIPAWSAFSQTTPIFSYRKLFFYYFNTDKNASGGALVPDNVLYLVSNNAIVAYDDDGGAGFTSKITMTSGSCSSGCYILGGAHTSTPDTEGNARLIVDPYTNFGDSDFDGLSNALESVLGTDSTKRDTDGDGLNDYLETVGSGDIELPWEGSSPTQKDVFLEVDYFGREVGNHWVFFFDAHQNYIKTQLANSFDRYGDIRLHIDVDDYLGEMSDTATLKFAVLGEKPGTNPDSSAYYMGTQMSTDFSTIRAGIFHWVVAANRHSSISNTSSGQSYRPGNRMIISLGHVERNNNGVVQSATQEEYTGTTLHELGHALYLNHNDNDKNGKSEIHRSVMNYRYQFSGAPKNVTLYFPPNIIPDSIWRYSTDNSSNRQGLDWNHTNIISGYDNVDTGENGCVIDPYYNAYCFTNAMCDGGTTCVNNTCHCSSNTDCYEGLVCESGICRSPKQSCRDAGSGAQPTCDCTFDEWAILDLTSGGNMVRSAFTSAGIISANGSPNDPFFGLEGYVVALNLEDLMTSGEKYTKLNKLNMTEKEKELLVDEKFYTKENRKIYNDAYKDYFRKKGYKENEDFFVTDDKVFLINDEKQMENLQ